MRFRDLPGFDRALDWTPIPYYVTYRVHHADCLYPNALRVQEEGHKTEPTTLRELAMLRFMDEVTDKSNWAEKVFDEEITLKWKAEAMAQGEEVFSESMADYAIKELQHKAEVWKKTSAITAYDPGVVKSDSIVSEKLRDALKQAAKTLEQIPDSRKDWHPGSNEKVLDLVHPSLFPLIYGRTNILPDRTVDFKDPISAVGQGELLSKGFEHVVMEETFDQSDGFSRTFQWLPCEMQFTTEGKLKINSYINNLHPQSHPGLYAIIEEIASCALPLWNKTLGSTLDCPRRIDYSEVEYHAIPEEEKPKKAPGESEDDFWPRKRDGTRALREKYIVLPEPAYDVCGLDPMEQDLQTQFGKEGLQVIVKLANIHLTPESPEYEGGSWHVEGQLNEHICATALYYYDCDNITESRLSFRQSQDTEEFGMDFGYEQDDHIFLSKIYGKQNGDSAVQVVGSVVCKEGRLLTFPNILQHRVLPFELADKTKPGHRKILALFLIDPHMKIISTANVPPQQKEWWAEKLWDTAAFGAIPREIHENIVGQADHLMSMEEAKEWRLKLMEERKNFVLSYDEIFTCDIFSLCEH